MNRQPIHFLALFAAVLTAAPAGTCCLASPAPVASTKTATAAHVAPTGRSCCAKTGAIARNTNAPGRQRVDAAISVQRRAPVGGCCAARTLNWSARNSSSGEPQPCQREIRCCCQQDAVPPEGNVSIPAGIDLLWLVATTAHSPVAPDIATVIGSTGEWPRVSPRRLHVLLCVWRC